VRRWRNSGISYSVALDTRLLVREGSAPPRPPRLLDRVRETQRAPDGSRRTEKAYVAWIRRYILFHGKRHPAEMGATEVTQFLSSLAVRGNVAAGRHERACGHRSRQGRPLSAEPLEIDKGKHTPAKRPPERTS
jgi:hypothetical protein